MFDSGAAQDVGDSPMSAATLRSWIAALPRLDRSVDDAERVSQLRLLEQLKSAAAAAQAVVTADFVASQRAGQRAAGVAADRVGQGIGAQVALARQSRRTGGRGWWVWPRRSPPSCPRRWPPCGPVRPVSGGPRSSLERPPASDPADRRAADAELGPRLARLGDREVEALARSIAYRLDPHAFVARTRGAARDRRVSLRPAPDTMSRLTGFLPVAQGVAAYAALSREADRLTAEGDRRGRGQIMADTMVERLTGQATASATPVEVHLVMPEETLLRGADEPAHLVGGGPLPAEIARELVRDRAAGVWLRRLYARPRDGALVAMESRRRAFPPALRRAARGSRPGLPHALVRGADQACRPRGGPLRGGGTSEANGQGLCEACNYAKQAPGWQARPSPRGAGDRVDLTTPTGHRYASRPPPLPGSRPPPGSSRLEIAVRRLLEAA